MNAARDIVVDSCRSLARFGPKRFYVLNTGASTRHALGPASEILAAEGIALRRTTLETTLAPLEAKVAEQPFGSRADEIETSRMRDIAPETVEMTKAVRDCNLSVGGPLVREPREGCTYSPSGAWGDPTLATRDKGRFVIEGWVAATLREIEDLGRLQAPFVPQRNNE